MINPELFKEISPLSDKDCFILIERKKSNFNFPIHVHPEAELNFIENAAGALRIVGDSTEEIGDEDLTLVANPHLEHAWMDHNNKSANIYEITIQFHRNLLSEDFLSRNQMVSIRHLFQEAQYGVVFSPDTIANVRPMLKTLMCERDSFYSLMKLLMVLHELSMDKAMRRLSSGRFMTQALKQNRQDSRLTRIMDYLNLHYADKLSLTDIAGLAHMSEASFSRFIKQHTSKSFVDFLTDIRLGAAARELVDTSLSIAEIGYNCGFNNLSNFNRIFKKRKGVTPHEYRDNYRKNKVII